MSSIFNSKSHRRPNTWVAWFILGIHLTVTMQNPIFLIFGTVFSIAHEQLLLAKGD
jgi:hypothetical protein